MAHVEVQAQRGVVHRADDVLGALGRVDRAANVRLDAQRHAPCLGIPRQLAEPIQDDLAFRFEVARATGYARVERRHTLAARRELHAQVDRVAQSLHGRRVPLGIVLHQRLVADDRR